MGFDAALTAGSQVDVFDAEEAEGPEEDAVPEQVAIDAVPHDGFRGV
jgi:hypothetical protein